MVGPLAFVSGWAVLGAGADGYDPTRNAISRLAAMGAPTRPAMTGALVALGVGMGLYAAALRPRRPWLPAAANSLTTLAVAGMPLGAGVDTAHGLSAAVSYLTLAAIPLVAAPLAPNRAGRRAAIAAGALSGLCLLATTVTDRPGLFQRVGLTVAQAWVVVNALGLVSAPTSRSSPPPAPGPAPLPR